MEPIVIPIHIVIELEIKPTPAVVERYSLPIIPTEPPNKVVDVEGAEVKEAIGFHPEKIVFQPQRAEAYKKVLETPGASPELLGVTIGEVPVSKDTIRRIQKIKVDALTSEKEKLEAKRLAAREYWRAHYSKKARQRAASEALFPDHEVKQTIHEDGISQEIAPRKFIRTSLVRAAKPEEPLNALFVFCPAGDTCYRGTPGKFVAKTGYRDLDTDREWCSYRCWEMHEEMRQNV